MIGIERKCFDPYSKPQIAHESCSDFLLKSTAQLWMSEGQRQAFHKAMGVMRNRGGNILQANWFGS